MVEGRRARDQRLHEPSFTRVFIPLTGRSIMNCLPQHQHLNFGEATFQNIAHFKLDLHLTQIPLEREVETLLKDFLTLI
jgi:hypothetical protein